MFSQFFKNFDIFSQPIQFNSSKQTLRKRTFVGALLSLCIISVSLVYFFYLTYLYLSNQVEPKFRSQSFITNEDIDITLQNNFFAFQIKEYRGTGNLDILQTKTNQTYIVLLAFYQFTNSSGFYQINLDIYPCQDPSLIGYNCLDYSKVPDKKITTANMKNVFSQITILAYKCQDVDIYKSTAPNNCASPQDIDAYIANLNNLLSIKLYTSQFNTTSQQMQTNYKHQYVYMSIKQLQVVEFKAQKQISNINQGPIIQQQRQYSSPISYTVNGQAIDLQTAKQQGFSMFMQILFEVDEAVEYIDIQYPTYPEILAQINSALAILMGLGVLARYMAQNLIKQELFILILKAFYQQTFFKILQLNKIENFEEIFQLDYQITDRKIITDEGQDPVCVPQLHTKSCFQKLRLQSQDLRNSTNDEKDEVLESLRISQQPYLLESNSNQNSLSNKFDFSKNQSDRLKSVRSTFKQQEEGKKLNLQTNTKRSSESIKFSQNISPPISAKSETKSIKGFILQNLDENQNKLFKQNQSTENIYKKRHITQLSENVSKELQNILFKTKLFQKSQYLESIGINMTASDCIFRQVNKSLDFLSFYSEVLLLKKAIMMILSEDQFAALQMVGASDDYIKVDNNEGLYTLNDNSNKLINHFEQQLCVQNSSQMQIKQMKKFLERYQENQNLTDIDRRIFSSIV